MRISDWSSDVCSSDLASSSSDNDEYNGLLITIASGLGAGQTRRVKDYVGSSKTVTVDTDWDTPPDHTSVYSLPAQVVYAPVSGGFESRAEERRGGKAGGRRGSIRWVPSH